jgi:hypothetical protein
MYERSHWAMHSIALVWALERTSRGRTGTVENLKKKKKKQKQNKTKLKQK